MQKLLYFFLFLVIFCFSCTTTEKIYSFQTSDGNQNYFLRPFEIKTSSNKVIKISMDFTVSVKEGSIVKNPILNFSIFIPKEEKINTDNFYISLVKDEIECKIIQKDFLFRQIQKNNLEIRFTSELELQSFKDLLKDTNNILIKVYFSENNFEEIHSKELDERFMDLGFILW